jgi:hypothetical protein
VIMHAQLEMLYPNVLVPIAKEFSACAPRTPTKAVVARMMHVQQETQNPNAPMPIA